GRAFCGERGSRRGGRNHNDTKKQKGPSRSVRREPRPRQCFLCEYNKRDSRQCCTIHDAERKEDDKEKPAAAQTIGSMQQAHFKCASRAVAPCRHNEVGRRATL